MEAIAHREKPYRLAALGSNGARTRVPVRDVEIGGPHFTVIAGPCSAETPAQIETIAGRVLSAGARLFRAGVYKPRTSPYSFQGLGDDGLAMLDRVAGQTMPIVCEALDADQMRLAAEHADVIQVGARNMHNTSLLLAAARCGRPVLLKRGFAATLEELLLAAEYVLLHGNPNVVLCERGIRTFDDSTRNTADLAGVARLRQLTHLPILVDPSHATGRADLVAPVALAALAAGADGLLVEVHNDPARSWSDPEQALSCDDFDDLMSELIVRAPLSGRSVRPAAVARAECLERHRDTIDRMDAAVLALLSERVAMARVVGQIKTGLGLPFLDREREQHVLDHVAQLTCSLSVGARQQIFRTVMDQSLSAEELLAGGILNG